MARITFTGLCNGTEEHVSEKTGKPYKSTEFVDLTGKRMQVFMVFGDLGLPKDTTPREYVLEGQVVSLGGVRVAGGPAVKSK